MIYIVSKHDRCQALQDAHLMEWHGTYSDAKRSAKGAADHTGETYYIYGFQQEDCIEPESKTEWRLEFTKTENASFHIYADTLDEAVQEARLKYPSSEWDLTFSYKIGDPL